MTESKNLDIFILLYFECLFGMKSIKLTWNENHVKIVFFFLLHDGPEKGT